MSREIETLARLAQRISVCHHNAVYWSFVLSILSLTDLAFLMLANAYPLGVVTSALVLFLFMSFHILILLTMSNEPFSLALARLLNVNLEEINYLKMKCKRDSHLSVVVALGLLIFMSIMVILALYMIVPPSLSLSLFTIAASALLKFYVMEIECLAISALYAIPIAILFVIVSVMLKLNILTSVMSTELAYDITLITMVTSLGVRECVSAKNW